MTIGHGPKRLEEVSWLLWKSWQFTGVPLECELCGHNSWRVLHDGRNDGASLPLRAGTTPGTVGPHYLAYGVECEKCGNVRLQGKDKVEQNAAAYDAAAQAPLFPGDGNG